MDAFRYFLDLSYVGTNYCGWQIQSDQISIQQTIEEVLSMILGEHIKLTGAGRTDSGVHALHYTAHFVSAYDPFAMQQKNLVYKLNRVLPPDIAIKSIRNVDKQAHARFSAKYRSYAYHICQIKDPFWHNRAWLMERAMDLKKMREATSILCTYENFESFAKSNSQVTNFQCKIMSASWEEKDNLLSFNIQADRFLRNMVRAIVGTLVDVGLGKISPDQFAKIIESGKRSNAGYSVPGHGLYFMGAAYDSSVFLP